MVLCVVSGNSLGFRDWVVSGWIIAYEETLNVQFSGRLVGRFMYMGETFCPFCRGGTWRGHFAWVETSALCFCETSGCFSGIMETSEWSF